MRFNGPRENNTNQTLSTLPKTIMTNRREKEKVLEGEKEVGVGVAEGVAEGEEPEEPGVAAGVVGEAIRLLFKCLRMTSKTYDRRGCIRFHIFTTSFSFVLLYKISHLLDF